jgi:putative ABC transport system permease protein
MLLNYLKLSLRLLIRTPMFTIINLIGLSVGFAAFFILWQHSSSELKSDQYHKDYERIARIGAHWRMNNDGESVHWIWGNIFAYQSALIFSDFPEIEDHTRFIRQAQFKRVTIGHGTHVVLKVERSHTEPKEFNEMKVISADPNLFEFFTIPLLSGDQKNLLKKANSIVLSEKTATRYFGASDPVNQLIRLNDSVTLVVTGVFKDLPKSTHLNFDIVLSNAGRELNWDEPAIAWAETYVKLNGVQEIERFGDKLNQRKERYWDYPSKTWPQARQEMYVQPLKEIAFSHLAVDGFLPKSRPALLLLQGVSVLILIMAWINYINLAVSRTIRRLKEIATRKVSGAMSGDFVKQFLIESSMMNLLAIAIALTLVQLIRQPLQLIFEIEIPRFVSIPAGTWIVAFAFVISGIVITALYPAYMSIQYNPRKLMTIQGDPVMRKFLPSMLTTFQYVSAFALILWGFIMYAQLNFILDNDMGLNKNQVVILDAPVAKTANFMTNLHSFLVEVRRKYGVTFSNNIVGDKTIPAGVNMKRPGQAFYRDIACNGGVDEFFVPFYGIKLLAGRNFQSGERKDAIIISRNATQRLGFDNIESALGARVLAGLFSGSARLDSLSEMEVIGIIEDYPLYPLTSFGKEEDKSVSRNGICLTYENKVFPELMPERIAFRLDPENFDASISDIRNDYDKLFPGTMFNWYFLKDHINRSYGHEKIIRNQIALCTLLAIGIACLGLLGMVTNKADEKTKEIGIRKALGARIHQIGTVLLQSTVYQMITAIVLSVPIAFYLGQQYLEKYTQRVNLHWWHFALPVFLLLIIMFITIVSVLIKASRTNPVEMLRYE